MIKLGWNITINLKRANQSYLILNHVHNLNDPEVLIIYMDFKQVDVIETLNKIQHKNIVLRYKFTDCLSNNEHHVDLPKYHANKTESFQARSTHKDRLHKIFDPYQAYILNQTRLAKDLNQLANVLENHPNFIIQVEYKHPKEQKLNFTGQITKEEFFIVNHKCVRLNRHTTDPIYLNLKIMEAFKESLIFSQYVENPQQLYENILSLEHKLPVFNPKFLSQKSQAFLTLEKPKTDEDLAQFKLLIQQLEKQYELTDLNLLSDQQMISRIIQVLLIVEIKHTQEQFTTFDKTLNYEFLVEMFSSDPYKICQKDLNQPKTENIIQTISQMDILSSQDLCNDNSICQFPFMMINQNDIQKQSKLKLIDTQDKLRKNSIVLILASSQDQEVLNNLKKWVDQLQQIEDQVTLEIVDNFNNHLLLGQLSLGQETYIFINGILVDSFGLTQRRFQQLISSEIKQANLLLDGIQLKNKFDRVRLINEIKLTEYSKRNSSLPDEFNCIEEYEKAANLTIALNKYKTVENPILNFKAKLNVLTRDSVNFVSLINQIKLGFKIEIAFFTQRSLGIKMKYIPYYYFRIFFANHQIFNENVFKIQNLSSRYQDYSINLLQQRKQVFVINEITHYYELDDIRLENKNSSNKVSVFGQKGYSLVFNTESIKKLESQQNEQQNRFSQNEKNITMKEKFMLLDGVGKFIQSYYSILHQYLQLNLQEPGRYYLIRENTQELITFDFSSVIQSDGILDQLEFYQDYDSQIFRFSELDEFKTNFNFQDYLKIDKKDTVNIYYTVSGSLFEKFALYQMQQMLEQNTQEQYRFLIYEGTFCSPSFKKSIFKLKGKYSFDLDFINQPWPHDIAFQDPDPKRAINLYRLMFLDNSLPHDIDRVIYRDADQCNLENSDMRELQNTDIQDFPQAMVPHCRHYNNKGYDMNQVMKSLGKNLTYFTNNIILIDTKKLRESLNPDIILNFYQAAVQKWGFDPFLLSQDIQSTAQLVVPIFPLHEDWEWAESFCDPHKKVTARIIDFQDMKKEDKLKIAKRVCPNYSSNFISLLDFLSN
ncbi:udp-glucose:glycoprotein glucosyltransferase-like [Stylonychia lemnae]|uniref:Udp-glucose:glycoprotein glucosyltransferase-like n=1 Tax=Stylonychia lemnae TaxID=5949 RepID=A0A078ACC1_STYLE|nr:udp-glucose:glycoprotein glucosyltransferase-like [Stylonychia lemnae]|eukprot:CDW79242.1 udp-glucose:glycoprotein glucosyltransferase-like [Stylonychia lemnae]